MSLFQGLLDNKIDRADVLARSHFGKDAAKLGVQIDLRGYRAG
jgi:hypothetical protein